jgi:prepilin-type N-terminal cleavage/methylation domain-containing protein
MRRAKLIRGFTLLEILTAMAIVAIMIGLLIPAIGMVQKTAQTVKQKSQFHAIEIALEAFNTDWGDYPPSSYTNLENINGATTTGYCGPQKLAEAIVGMDGFGFHPKSQWRSDGTADFNGDGTPELIYDVVNGVGPGGSLQSASDNLKARKGPYLELEKANAVKLGSLYTNANGMYGVVAENTYVLCDMFGLVKNLSTGKKAGLPVLYFKADTNKALLWPTGARNNIPTNPWDSRMDNVIYNVNDNFPFFDYMPNGYPFGSSHPMFDRSQFYQRIANPNFTNPQRPYRAQTFILLSAGADGLYGTSDDVYNIDENDK